MDFLWIMPLPPSLNITSYPLSSTFPMQGLDYRPSGSGTITHITQPLTLTVESNHQENIPFFITSTPVHTRSSAYFGFSAITLPSHGRG